MKQSAGILLYQTAGKLIEVLLVHPGGPFWAKKDAGAWSIPKGECAEGEDPLAAAKRECAEEFGQPLPAGGELLPLGSVKQSSSKTVHAWALAADFDASHIKSNTLKIEWPPKSGRELEIPEVDRAAWFPLAKAQANIVKGQLPLLERLAAHLGQTLTLDQRPVTEIDPDDTKVRSNQMPLF